MMNKLLLLLLLPCFTAFTDDPPATLPIEFGVEMDNKLVTVSGWIGEPVFDAKSVLLQYQEAFGPQDGTMARVGRNLTIYNRFGMVLVEDPKSFTIAKIKLQYLPQQSPLAAKGVFTGSLILNGHEIDPEEEPAKTIAATKLEFQQPGGNIYITNNGAFAITLQYKEDGQLELVTIQFKEM